jgi:hypothetical protein
VKGRPLLHNHRPDLTAPARENRGPLTSILSFLVQRDEPFPAECRGLGDLLLFRGNAAGVTEVDAGVVIGHPTDAMSN